MPMLPPRVPRFRICGEPTVALAHPRKGMCFAMFPTVPIRVGGQRADVYILLVLADIAQLLV